MPLGKQLSFYPSRADSKEYILYICLWRRHRYSYQHKVFSLNMQLYVFDHHSK